MQILKITLWFIYHDSVVFTIVSRLFEYYHNSEYIRNYRPALIIFILSLSFVVTFLIDESHLSSLMTALVSVVDWFTLGVYLGVEYHTLEEIRIQRRDHVSHCKSDMLIAWLKSSKEPCTKHQLSNALWYTTHSE